MRMMIVPLLKIKKKSCEFKGKMGLLQAAAERSARVALRPSTSRISTSTADLMFKILVHKSPTFI